VKENWQGDSGSSSDDFQWSSPWSESGESWRSLRPQLLGRAQDLVTRLEAGVSGEEDLREARLQAHELATALAEHASPALAALGRDFDRTLERQGVTQALPVGRILVRVLAEDGGVRPPSPRRP
jgi:hypothetical protein